MFRRFLLGKIHNGKITGVNKDYVGSVEIDPDIYEAAGMATGEIVAVLDMDNGERFETYIIEGVRGDKKIEINGAAARKVYIGDRIIILSYVFTNTVPDSHTLITLDENNDIVNH